MKNVVIVLVAILALPAVALLLNAAETPAKPVPAPSAKQPTKPAPVPAPATPEKRPDAKPAPSPASKPAPSPPPGESAKPVAPGKPAPAPAPAPVADKPGTPAPAPAGQDKKDAPPDASGKQAVPPPAANTASGSASKRKTIAEFTKGMQKLNGLFDIYVDRSKGYFFLQVRKDQIGPEFIYFNQTVDGVVQAGLNRGRYGDEMVFKIRRSFDRLEIVEQNTAFYFDPQSPLARASSANISNSLLASESIVASDDAAYLISGGNLFLKETMLMVKPMGGDSNKSVLGKLSDSKTKWLNIRTYRDNCAITVEYVYENSSPTWVLDRKANATDIADPRNISIKILHNLIRMPENDYKPRVDDPRVGYFSTQVTDMTTTKTVPYRDVIHRWHLVKQKPGTALSEPVKPIVFWIENTTPVEFRDTIRSAALRWNEAFAAAGFKDALVIKQQPDNANWDAGDINYNVLRWTSSPSPPFGGYGPSFVNPRTGEILGADVMLEYSYVTNRLRTSRLFDELGLASLVSQDDPNGIPSWRDEHGCMAGACAQQGILFGNLALQLTAAEPVELKKMVHEALHYLVLHELGHTLGLNHNFRSSQLYDAVTIHKREVTEKTGLMGSVMDYPPANIAPEGTPQGQYYTTRPGPYDHWAIEYGYSEGLEDPAKERERLQKIASRSHEAKLAFANDADDMRRTGKGIDPRAMLFDMSSDPVIYGGQRCDLVHGKIDELLKKAPKPGESWQPLAQAYITLTTEEFNALAAVSRYVGGVYVERAFVGQAPNVSPYRAVEKERQLRALAVLEKHAFGPSAWNLPPDLIAHLQQQRRGFEFNKEDEDPKLLDRILKFQRSLLDHLTHTEVQRRILDSGLYGNELSLGDVMGTLTRAVFDGDPASGPVVWRQNLQNEYVGRLLGIVNGSGYQPAAQAVAFGELMAVRKKLESPALRAAAAHRDFLAYKIRRGLDEH